MSEEGRATSPIGTRERSRLYAMKWTQAQPGKKKTRRRAGPGSYINSICREDLARGAHGSADGERAVQDGTAKATASSMPAF